MKRLKTIPRTLRFDKALEAEIKALLLESDAENFSQFARRLFRLGVAAERDRQNALKSRKPEGAA